MPATILKRAALLLLLPLAACAASPEQRVRAALVDAGVREEVARCMAERMAALMGSVGETDRALSTAGAPRQSLHPIT